MVKQRITFISSKVLAIEEKKLMSYAELKVMPKKDEPQVIEITYRDDQFNLKGFGVTTELLKRLAARGPGATIGEIPAELMGLVLEKAQTAGLLAN